MYFWGSEEEDFMVFYLLDFGRRHKTYSAGEKYKRDTALIRILRIA
jgi:hypothetical protein